MEEPVQMPWPSYLSKSQKNIIEQLDFSTMGIKVKNPFSKQECELCREQVAVYDFIKGSEAILVNYDEMQSLFPSNVTKELISRNMSEMLAYFKSVWSEEYYILLD